MQMEDSDGDEDEDGGMDREKIANQLFDDDVSMNICRAKKKCNKITLSITFCLPRCLYGNE